MARVFGKFFIFTLLIFAGAFCGAESFRVRKVYAGRYDIS